MSHVRPKFWLHALSRTFTLNVLDIPPAKQAVISKGVFETEEIPIRTLLNHIRNGLIGKMLFENVMSIANPLCLQIVGSTASPEIIFARGSRKPSVS